MGKKIADNQQTKEELMAITVAEIVSHLIIAHKEKRDVNLNKLRGSISSKYGLTSQPKLTDIIAAVPTDYKDVLLPKLKAKP
uniref:ELP3-like N-terminal domain-containing protein n=1 Tax=Romanomermis culicivorax TaxID=13658 RepID=A0A915K0W5_ROMCU